MLLLEHTDTGVGPALTLGAVTIFITLVAVAFAHGELPVAVNVNV